jgi:hypothetical protein
MKFETILKRLIVADIAFCVVSFGIGWFGDPFLTGPLRVYSDGQLNLELSSRDWFLLLFDLVVLVFSIVAWGLLWRGSPKGRLLYTSAIAVFLVLLPFEPPFATSGVIALIDTIGTMIVGGILGMLYFSDLKLHYEPNVA